MSADIIFQGLQVSPLLVAHMAGIAALEELQLELFFGK
jgi:hypothetical protein